MSQESLEQIIDRWEDTIKRLDEAGTNKDLPLKTTIVLAAGCARLELCLKDIKEYRDSLLKNNQSDVKRE